MMNAFPHEENKGKHASVFKKMTFVSIVVGTVFAGIAGFVEYGVSHEYSIRHATVVLLSVLFLTLLISYTIYFFYRSIVYKRLIKMVEHFREEVNLNRPKMIPEKSGDNFYRDEIDEIIQYMNTRIRKINELDIELSYLKSNSDKKVVNETKELEKKNKDLTSALDRNKTLLKIVIHDISNPLTVINSSVQKLISRKLYSGELGEKFAKKIDRGAQNIMEILGEVKELEALKEGKKTITPIPVDLSEVMNNVLFLIQERMDKKEIKFNFDNQVEKKKVLAEKVSLSNNVIANILTNAIKFCHEGGNIEVVAKEVDGRICVELIDNGIGIPEEILENLFDANAETSRKGTGGESGTGFGMPIVKSYMELYGGEIEVKSTVAKKGNIEHGTTFFLYFEIA